MIVEPFTSSEKASVIEAEPSAMPMSIDKTEADAGLDQEVRRAALHADIDRAIAGERRDHPVERIARIADADDEVGRQRRKRSASGRDRG